MKRLMLHILLCVLGIKYSITWKTWNFNDQYDYEMALERLELVWKSDKIFADFTTKSFKYNRTATAFNLDLWLNVDVTTWKVTIYFGKLHIIFYKLSENQYKRTAVQTVLNFCDLLKHNSFDVGTMFKVNGNISDCPIDKKKYVLRNAAINGKRFPPNLRDGRGRLEIISFINEEKACILNWYIEIKYFVKPRKQ